MDLAVLMQQIVRNPMVIAKIILMLATKYMQSGLNAIAFSIVIESLMQTNAKQISGSK
jgi:hypothetical protein